MKTLVVVNFPPYPPASGAPLRVWQHINVLATQGPVYVFSVGGERNPADHTIPGVAGWTHFNNSDFSTSNGSLAKIARTLLPRQYIVPDTFARFKINRALKRALKQIRPDVIVLSHWKNACPTPLRGRRDIVVDLHNIESLLGTGVRTVVRSRLLRTAILWRWQRRERALLRQARRIWVCGPNDVEALKVLDPNLPPPVIVPNAVDLKRYAGVRNKTVKAPERLTQVAAPTLIYVGLFSYHPNTIAARELIDEVFPLITERIPGARLLLVGAKPTEHMLRAAALDPRIVVTGAVDDLEPYLAAADVCVVPLRSGGGTRLKILECFASRIAVVSTAKGAEGLHVVAGREMRIGETPRELADGALDLLTDDRARRSQVEAAYDLVAREYSWDALAGQIQSALSGSDRTAPQMPAASTSRETHVHGSG